MRKPRRRGEIRLGDRLENLDFFAFGGEFKLFFIFLNYLSFIIIILFFINIFKFVFLFFIGESFTDERKKKYKSISKAIIEISIFISPTFYSFQWDFLVQ